MGIFQFVLLDFQCVRFICYLYLLPGKGSWCESTRDVSVLFLKHGSALMKARLTPTRGERGGRGGQLTGNHLAE